MKRLLMVVIVLLILSAPALGQSAPVDPAAYLPDDTAAYLELRSDDAGLSALDQAVSLSETLTGSAQGDAVDTLIAPLVSGYLPGIDVGSDVLSWAGDEVGIAQIEIGADPLIVLPIGDAAGAQAFVSQMSGGASANSVGGVTVYTTRSAGLAVAPDVIWLGSPDGISSFVKTPMLERLSDNPQYQKVRAALPADAALTAYASGAYVNGTVSASALMTAVFQAALRLHPAQSAAEDALLQSPALNGLGLAVEVSGGSLDATGVLSVNAQYPAPTLANATAGTALFSLPPSDSFVVFDSYDASVLGVALGLTSYMQSSVQAIFASVRAKGAATPTQAPSADTLVAQMQPILAQAESLMGLSLDQLDRLIDGEYAVAIFPGPGPTVGEALYLQSSNPQQIIGTLDHVSTLILTDPTSGAQLVTPTQASIDGLNVTLLATPYLAEPLALGALNANTLFLTSESLAAKVIDAALKPSSPPPFAALPGTFGATQAALLYAAPRTVDLYATGRQRSPPLGIDSLAGSFEVGENGLFTLHLSAHLAS